jgi:hypothetical protein
VQAANKLIRAAKPVTRGALAAPVA